MKRLSFLRIGLLAALWGLLGVSVHVSAQSSVQTLNLKNTSCVNWQTDIYPGNYSTCEQGGFWTSTYDSIANPPLCFNPFVLSHNSGFNVYSYWGGFTLSVSGDSLCYSGECPASCGCVTSNPNCSLSGSNAWVQNQWGVMAGGGLADVEPYTPPVKGNPYLVAYWDYYSDSGGAHSLQISLNGDSLFTPNEVYVCNHPWPYYGNLYGDGFAQPLPTFGDTAHVDLIIHAIHADGSETSITRTLAAVYNGQVVQSPNWQSVSLLSLGTDVKALYFTMYSSDSDPQWGPNTAVYFCLDKLKVTKTGAVAPASAVARKATASAPKPVEVADYFPLASYTGGEVSVYNAAGKEVLKTTVKAGEKPNLSKLPAGEYRLRHGHKHIPIRKVK
jgi:hypothetical protein